MELYKECSKELNVDLNTTQLMLQKPNLNINYKKTDGWDKGYSSLHQACILGHLEVVKLLLNKGADVNIQDDLGVTPLHHACYKGHIVIVQVLLDFGASCNITSNYSETSLHKACKLGYIEIIEILLDHGAAQNIKNKDGKKPLDFLNPDQLKKLDLFLHLKKNLLK